MSPLPILSVLVAGPKRNNVEQSSSTVPLIALNRNTRSLVALLNSKLCRFSIFSLSEYGKYGKPALDRILRVKVLCTDSIVVVRPDNVGNFTQKFIKIRIFNISHFHVQIQYKH